MVAGGCEASIDPLSMAGFARMRALSSKFNDDPTRASRPFDSSRNGFVMGEGAGMVVLEELEHARKRGARIYCEVLGYGLSGDAHHITSPSAEARGAILSMRRAFKGWGSRGPISPQDIDYVNAHATSTPVGDEAELRGISTVFADKSGGVAVSSIKGSIGHLLGAAGAVEGIATILAIRDDVIPPTLNLEKPVEVDSNAVNHVAHKSARQRVNIALTNSFGFGGTNASLVLAKYTK